MFKDKVILITGGTGSFGKAFTKMVLKNNSFKKLIIYSRDEYKQFILKNELIKEFGAQSIANLRFFIGDVRDKERLCRAFQGVDYVIHAAAMKQVPACEYNPFEAIKTNIHGAQNVIDAALDCQVKKVVALSTDKSVNPINLYGGTKLVSDKLFIAANAYRGIITPTVFSVVRYGNVASSRGSVIPFFQDLLSNGAKEIPITNFDMTRFWITLEQGVDLVMHALRNSTAGEIYIAKIPSFRVVDLARAIGGSDIILNEVGIREGEKLHEIMITKEDSRFTYDFDKYYIIVPNFDWYQDKNNIEHYSEKVKLDFEYASNTNTQWLNEATLHLLLKDN